MMRRLKRWWQRLVGRPHDDDSHHSTTRHAPGDATRNPDNQASKPPVVPGGLTLAEDKPTQPKARSGKAGFDPYSSDAGYSKPHGWDRVDHD